MSTCHGTRSKRGSSKLLRQKFLSVFIKKFATMTEHFESLLTSLFSHFSLHHSLFSPYFFVEAFLFSELHYRNELYSQTARPLVSHYYRFSYENTARICAREYFVSRIPIRSEIIKKMCSTNLLRGKSFSCLYRIAN